ncbi:MAG: hypothetical protein PHV59_11430, partial [Victivallales bacterium]|nr:hypothetical protein [Victivallales bacterium]
MKVNDKFERSEKSQKIFRSSKLSELTFYKAYQAVFKFSAVAVITWFACLSLQAKAEDTELQKLVPEAKGYKLIYKLNPLQYASKDYQINNSERFSGTLKKIGYLLKLTDKKDKLTWVFVSMDPFSQDLKQLGVPDAESGVIQQYVNNLEIFSNSPKLKTGKFEKGNIEFWPNNYSGSNVKKIPGATNNHDFGDGVDLHNVNGYGSMQVHNYLEKQTVFAFNHWNSGKNCDVGIGNNTSGAGRPDWTSSASGKNYKDAQLAVVGIFDKLKIVNIVKPDPAKISVRGETAKAFYAPGEKMVFTLNVDYGNQPAPSKPYTLKWRRTGDDQKTADGTETVTPGKAIVIKTSSNRPGFVRLQAELLDDKGHLVKQTDRRGRKHNIGFYGGSGVEPEKLQPAVTEPADFDQFWAKEKAKLDAVPLKYDMKKVSKPGVKVEVYAVSVA